MASALGMARRLPEWLHDSIDPALPDRGIETELRGASKSRRRVHRIRLGSSQTRPVSCATYPAGRRLRCGRTWPQWLVDDQREASGRPDVTAFVSEVLTSPTKISGQPIVNLVASTSGTDSDWVAKLIDVYPDEVAEQPVMGGYQLPVAMDIFRGRYRESLETARPLTANEPLRYRFALPTTNHVFAPGHRIMVQIQSSWFPLYDRNPQTFVPNIFLAKPEDYRRAVQRIYHASDRTSFIELPVVVMR